MADEPGLQMVMEILLDLQQSQRDMRHEMRDGFQRVETRLDRLEARMDQLDGRLGRLEARMDRLEARQDAMETLLRQHTRRLDTLTLDVSNIRRDLSVLRVEVRDYHGSVIGHGVQITDLDERVRRIEEHLGLSRM